MVNQKALLSKIEVGCDLSDAMFFTLESVILTFYGGKWTFYFELWPMSLIVAYRFIENQKFQSNLLE